MKPTVLILGGGLQAVSTARSLKERGYRIGLLSSHKDYSCKSSALDFVNIHSSAFDIKIILNIIRQENVRVVIPMSDKGALLLSSYKQAILAQTGCVAAVPDYEAIDIAADKLKLMELCRIHGFPHPLTVSDSALSSCNPDKLPYPLLIKPNHSVGARGIVKINNPQELMRRLPEIQAKFGDCHLQEYIDGNLPYYNVMIYRDKNGEITNSAILEIIRFYPLNGGSSSLCKTIASPELIDLCSRVLEKINYHGFADFDILKNTLGEYKIIEINPRVPASLRGAAVSGVNFPAIIAGEALNINESGGIYRPGKTLRYLGLDIMWFLSSPNRRSASPSWFRFFGKDIFYQEGGWKDWKPMLAALWSNVDKIEFKNGKLRKKD